MSFLELVKLIPKGLKNPMKVVEGYVNDIKLEYGNLPEEEVEEIAKRRLICDSCPFNSILARESQEYYDIFKEHYKTDRDVFHCAICSCPLKKKTASLSSDCGIDSDDKTKHLPLKWKAIK